MLSTYPGTLSAHSRRNTRVGLSVVGKVANKKKRKMKSVEEKEG